MIYLFIIVSVFCILFTVGMFISKNAFLFAIRGVIAALALFFIACVVYFIYVMENPGEVQNTDSSTQTSVYTDSAQDDSSSSEPKIDFSKYKIQPTDTPSSNPAANEQ